MPEDKWIRGNDPLPRRINVRSELSRIRSNPLATYLVACKKAERFQVLSSAVDLFQEAYQFYYLSLARFLPEMSLAIRWCRGPYWARREGRRYTPYERETASRYNRIAKFIEYEFFNTLLHARILLDRAIALSRPLFSGSHMPSFTSFADHKKFLIKHRGKSNEPSKYVTLVCDQTDWFDTPLKEVRDKFLVHACPKHLRFFGYPSHNQELGLMLVVPTNPRSDTPLADVTVVTVSIPRLSRDIERFLTEYNEILTENAGQ